MPERDNYPDASAYNKAFVEEFRNNRGVVTGPLANRTCLVLTTTGAKSGLKRETPLVYTTDGDRFVVSGANGGAPKHPDWYYNLLANPRATVEVGEEVFEVTVSQAVGEERDRIHVRRLDESPTYADGVKRTTRVIPLMILSRVVKAN